MGKYIFVENGILNGAGELKQTDENLISIEVSDNVYNEYINDRLKYTFEDGNIIENPDYADLKQKEHLNNRICKITNLLTEYDLKRIRAVCEDEIKDEKTGETWLDYYNSKIYDLRIELAGIKAQL